MILINLLSNQATTCKLCMKDGIYSICNSVRSLKYHINKTHKHSIEEYTFIYQRRSGNLSYLWREIY